MNKKIDTNEIIIALEEVDSIFPEIKGFNKIIKFPELRANITNETTAFSNRISLAKLSEETVDETISKVTAIYEANKVNCIWIVGPSSTPESLEEKLIQYGYDKFFTSDGMYIDKIPAGLSTDKNIRVEEFTNDNYDPLIQLMTDGFDMKHEDTVNYHRMLKRIRKFIKMNFYTAYHIDSQSPVASSYLTYIPDKPIALLSGATTLSKYRGKGIYKAMLVKRIKDAVDNGVTALIVSANQLTSSPICQKYGFIKVCELKIYKKEF